MVLHEMVMDGVRRDLRHFDPALTFHNAMGSDFPSDALTIQSRCAFPGRQPFEFVLYVSADGALCWQEDVHGNASAIVAKLTRSTVESIVEYLTSGCA